MIVGVVYDSNVRCYSVVYKTIVFGGSIMTNIIFGSLEFNFFEFLDVFSHVLVYAGLIMWLMVMVLGFFGSSGREDLKNMNYLFVSGMASLGLGVCGIGFVESSGDFGVLFVKLFLLACIGVLLSCVPLFMSGDKRKQKLGKRLFYLTCISVIVVLLAIEYFKQY